MALSSSLYEDQFFRFVNMITLASKVLAPEQNSILYSAVMLMSFQFANANRDARLTALIKRSNKLQSSLYERGWIVIILFTA